MKLLGQDGVRPLKYIIEEGGRGLVFDLATDPEERENLIRDHVAAAEEYRKRLDDWVVFSENLVERYAEILEQSDCRPAAPKDQR